MIKNTWDNKNKATTFETRGLLNDGDPVAVLSRSLNAVGIDVWALLALISEWM